jgi:5-methylcytosine-specific restriction protein A
MMKFCRCGKIAGQCDCRKRDRGNDSPESRGYDFTWRKLSKSYRVENPFCEVCFDRGKLTAVQEVHHKIKISDRPDLRLEWSNLMSVCRQCHKEIEGATPDRGG